MRVLWLDQYPQLAKPLFGPDDELHCEAPFFGIDRNEVYNLEGNPDVLRYIRARGSTYDLIVIGNNLKAGIPKAAALDPSVRHRAVVVWHDEPNEWDKDPYLALGYQHFTTRSSLVDYVLDHEDALYPDGL